MRSSPTITLFSERPELTQRSSSFLVSVAAHAAATGLLSYGILSTPAVADPSRLPHYAVRHLDLHTPQPRPAAASKAQVRYPGPRQPDNNSGGSPERREAALRLTAEAEPGPQTLVQPDIAHPAHLKQAAPVPTVVIWSPKKQAMKNIVAPLPEPATASDVKPSLQAPNDEVNLADLSVAASDAPSKLPLLPPSTTSPLTVHAPQKAQLPPATASQSEAAPTPAAVMSLSDLKMKDGPVTLPPVNETAAEAQPGPLKQGEAERASALGTGNPDSMAGGSGLGAGAAQPATNAAAGTDAGQASAGAQAEIAEARTYPSHDGGSAANLEPAVSHFELDRDGQFGAVVVGASIEDQYPEMAGLWGGRMAYTVYLHVGTEKSWILQYSIPRSADAENGGNAPRLDAPWPFNIVRPNLEAGAINADALMVHGYVNEGGRFEGLVVAFPPEFSETQYVLDALTQWQFRPAAQNGRPSKVEVVLIIPDTSE